MINNILTLSFVPINGTNNELAFFILNKALQLNETPCYISMFLFEIIDRTS